MVDSCILTTKLLVDQIFRYPLTKRIRRAVGRIDDSVGIGPAQDRASRGRRSEQSIEPGRIDRELVRIGLVERREKAGGQAARLKLAALRHLDPYPVHQLAGILVVTRRDRSKVHGREPYAANGAVLEQVDHTLGIHPRSPDPPERLTGSPTH